MITALAAESLALDRGGRRLFEGLSFTLAAGEAIALTGPNGAGKTSLLRALAGLLRPAAGQVRFTASTGPLESAEARSSALHWLGAADGLKGGRTVDAELRFWAAYAEGPEPRRPDSGVPTALESLGLAQHARTEVRRLSTGQRRRVALARLLASPRPLWLLDEPLAPLDAAWRARTGDIMRAHLDAGGLLVAAVHDPLPVRARELRLESA